MFLPAYLEKLKRLGIGETEHFVMVKRMRELGYVTEYSEDVEIEVHAIAPHLNIARLLPQGASHLVEEWNGDIGDPTDFDVIF